MPRLARLKWDALADRAMQQWAVDKPEVVAVDTETEGTSFYDPPFACTVAWRNSDGVQSHYFERGYGGDLPKLLDQTPKLVFHNAKFDLQKLILVDTIERTRLSSERIEDTETLAYLTNEHWDKHLKVLARDLLGLTTDETVRLKKAREAEKKKRGLRYLDEVGYHMIPREILYPYAKKDAEFTLLVWECLRPRIARYNELEALYEKELDLALCVLDIEAAGMKVRLDYVDEKVKEYNRLILEQELIIGDITGKKVWYPERPGQKQPDDTYNPNSWQQLLSALQVDDPHIAGTDEKTLAASKHPLAQATVSLRKNKKTLNTYLRGLQAEQRDGLVHPWFNISRVVSARFSSSKAEDG